MTSGATDSYVLTTDSEGNASWKATAAGSGTITGATNGLCKIGQNVVLGGALTGTTSISLSGATSLTFTDTRTTTSGVTYGGDYEEDFVARSLVTKKYVDDKANTIAVCNVSVSYTATTESDFVGISGASTLHLPATPKACQRITVADIEGNALSDNICIVGNGQCINGESYALINTNYGSMTFINNNVSGWSAVAFIN
jgi:hypothetical protein